MTDDQATMTDTHPADACEAVLSLGIPVVTSKRADWRRPVLRHLRVSVDTAEAGGSGADFGHATGVC